LQYEKFDKGMIRYFKSKSGSGLKTHIADRPTANQSAFVADVIRGNFAGLDWSVDFSVDPTKIGGASMRVCVDKINRSIGSDQDLILEPTTRRYNSYALSCVMQRPEGETGKRGNGVSATNQFAGSPTHRLADSPSLGLLPFDIDWYKWEFQGPAKVTADAKYNSDVDAQEIRIGIKTRTKAMAERGESLDDVRDMREKEVDDLLTRAQRQADKHGVPIDLVLARFEQDQLGGATPATPLAEAPPAQEQADTLKS
jgi:hypothetical protein